MVIKLLGGKKASIKYQLKNPTARILHGDPTVTQRLIDASHFSQKYCGIVLSFEENITAETESAILDDFRLMLRGGLEEDALDDLAVGQADKIHPISVSVTSKSSLVRLLSRFTPRASRSMHTKSEPAATSRI